MRLSKISGERLLIIMMYALLLSMLAFSYVWRNPTYNMFVITVLLIIIIIEMLYVFIVYPNRSLCDICKDMWCRKREEKFLTPSGGH